MPALTIAQAFDIARARHDAGDLAEARSIYEQILTFSPDHLAALMGLVVACDRLGALDDAITACRKLTALHPNHPQAHSNLGGLLGKKGLLDEAIDACTRAAQLDPQSFDAQMNLAVAMDKARRFAEAASAYRRAVCLRPTSAHAHHLLGLALLELGKVDQAIASFQTAIHFDPPAHEAYDSLGAALHDAGRYSEALACFDACIERQADYPEAHLHKAMVLLLLGRFAEAWDSYEWRWQTAHFVPWAQKFAQPHWDGRDLRGQRILLHSEQGFGDTFQFIRYAPRVAALGGQVIVQCQRQAAALVASVEGVSQVVARGDELPPFDVQFPLLSLPRLFNTTLTTIPASPSYISPDPALVAAWAKRRADLGGRASPRAAARTEPRPPELQTLKIGLVWAGSKVHRNDRNRSAPLSAFAPLAQVPGVSLHSLQKGDAAGQSPPAGLSLIDLTADLNDFADTAALIANLDLVISVDTSVLHLAGAMGRPVWALLPAVPDFRWLLHRADSPWYPSMRLFRQATPGDWTGVINSVAQQLCTLTAQRAAA